VVAFSQAGAGDGPVVLSCDECGAVVAWQGQRAHTAHHEELARVAAAVRSILAAPRTAPGRVRNAQPG
jgi:hypothetical protein